MYRLIVEGTELVLPENYKPDFSLNFAEIGKQSGSRVFPFTLPSCEVNDVFFGYAHNVQSAINRTKKWEGTLLNGSLFLAHGWLILKMSSVKGGHTCELQMPPALIDVKTWDTNIRSLDFGTVEMATQLKIEDCYTLKVTDSMKDKYPPNTFNNYRVYVGNAIFAEYAGEETWRLETNDWTAVYAGLSNDFNTTERVDAGWYMTYNEDILIVNAPANTSYIVSFALYRGFYGGVQPFQEGHEFSRLQYQSPTGFDSFLLNTPTNSMFCLPVIKAEKFYGDNNKNHSGFLNFGLGSFDRNVPRNPLKFALSPCLWFMRSFKKLLEILGYTAVGEFTTASVYQQAYFMTLVAIDRECPEAPFPFNIWKNSINLASHLPDMTVKVFLASICEQFGVDIDFDPLSKVANCTFIKTHIENQNVDSFGQLINMNYAQIEHNDKVKVQLKFASLNEAESADSYFNSVPVDADKLADVEYKPVEYKFVPPKLLNLSTDEKVAIVENNIAQGVNPPVRWMPVTEREGVSNLFDMWRNSPANYVSFFVGLVVPNAQSMLQSINERNNISLQLTGDKGFASRNQLIIRHQEGTYLLTVNIPLTDAQISVLKSWQKYHIGGVNFFLSALDGKAGEVLKLKFWKA
jgi:hypothetical protein